MVAVAERAMALSRGHESRRAAFFAEMAHGMALVAAGEGEAGAAAARRAVVILEQSDELRDDPRLLAWAAFGPMWLREAQAGRGLIDRAVERARLDAAVGVLPLLLAYVARDQATSEQWPAAEASFDEAIRLAHETGQRTALAVAVAGLACLEARQGREAACREHAGKAAALCRELGMGVHGAWSLQALGDLELALGRPLEAVAHHEAQAASLRARGIGDVDLSPAPELVDAYLRLGRRADAAATAVGFLAAAEEKRQPWALARAARCRGLLHVGDGLGAWFEQALRHHGRTPDAFETARTRLAYGACLRRSRQRVSARGELREALAIFERLGARPWADQANAELQATGETARRRDASTLDDLTPQERQIASLLAGGKTTREAAAAVFLSPKTIEYHLRHVYRKLGIGSREELAAAFSEPPAR
jgi:DNA-binding CsgD family transcriptional regulator